MSKTPTLHDIAPAYKDPESAIPVRPGIGDVKINNDLLPTIALYAALETRGVVSLSGRYGVDEVQNKRDVERGVAVTQGEGGRVTVDLEINVEFGYNIYETTLRLQQSVKNALEHMSGFSVDKVNVVVRGIFPQKRPPRPSGTDETFKGR